MTKIKLLVFLAAVISISLFPDEAFGQKNAKYEVIITAVTDNGIAANLYLPKVSGKHPAVIVIGGSEGGIRLADRWGEPLAARGYAVLSLAYFGIGMLPAQLEEIPLEYFKKAIDFVRAHPAVDSKRIAFIGNSKGGEAALLIAATYPEIKAVVAGVPSNVVWQSINFKERTVKSSWTLGDKPIQFVPYDTTPPFTSMSAMYLKSLENKAAVMRATIPVEKIKGAVLLVSGNDDKVWVSRLMSDLVIERLKKNNFRFKYEHLSYDNAGHAVLGPPSIVAAVTNNNPSASTQIDKLDFGGTKEANDFARADSWEKTLNFLDRNFKK